ncbi:Serotype-specific antigen 1 [Pandoraea pneumonica]|uniref:Serotype-specific antigen 1 n=1 Tax=Pandoraea pneumonica TaxID=2508299 RepID=A0A5E4T9D3_9BURK|nr:tyrosine-protein phosphatase [Pandoraea pneumonica]VVD83074.1 Serotype-specific antigen 1 [Pandoraea pneumonica]
MHKNLRDIALAASLCTLASAAAYADVSYPITTPRLASVDNFRDVAGLAASLGGTGTSNTVANNGVMRTGVFYRANALSSLSSSDSATLTSLGITQIVDLRTASEIASSPDRTVSGATYRNIDILGNANVTGSATSLTSVAAVNTYMTGMYQSFVTDASVRSQFKSLLLDLASANGAVLFHCTSGKDRTGWTSAILESIAGVSSNQIMTDYLATNTYSAATIAGMKQAILAQYTPTLGAAGAQQMANTYSALMGVSSGWLQASLDSVVSQYGSMQNYLIQGLGLTQADIYVLRAKMVYYNALPGQAALTGNAALGAALLVNLQNSPLSGHYTAFNNYLQSAIDSGTLGGVANRIGGQVHADAVAYLLTQPLAVESALRGHTATPFGAPAPDPVWVSVWTNTSRASGSAGSASSKSRENGVMVGITQPLTPQLSVYGAIGNENQRPEAADATATLNSMQLVAGARYAFAPEKNSLFVDGMLMGSRGNYDSTRGLGSGLGTATGSTKSWLYSAIGMVGKSFDVPGLTLTPQIGLRYTQASLSGFEETGSELALNMQGNKQHVLAARARVDLNFQDRSLGAWTIRPVLTLGVEQTLNSAAVSSFGTLQGYGISQTAAYNSRLFGSAELSLQATRGPVTAELRGAVGGGERGATSLAGFASLKYTF